MQNLAAQLSFILYTSFNLSNEKRAWQLLTTRCLCIFLVIIPFVACLLISLNIHKAARLNSPECFDSCQGKRSCSLQMPRQHHNVLTFHWLFPSEPMHKHGCKHRSKWSKWFEDALCISWAIGISTRVLPKTGIYLCAYLASLDGPLVSYDAYAFLPGVALIYEHTGRMLNVPKCLYTLPLNPQANGTTISASCMLRILDK